MYERNEKEKIMERIFEDRIWLAEMEISDGMSNSAASLFCFFCIDYFR